jgi:hypothetical protein
MALTILGLLLVAEPPLSAQSVSFWSTSSNTGGVNLGWSHTIAPGGEARYLLVGVSVDWSSRSPTVMSATYAGLPLGLLGTADDPGRAHLEIWGLPDPPEGNNLMSVRLTENASVAAGAASFTGVDPVRSTGPFLFAAGSSARATLELPTVAGERSFSVYAAGTDPSSLDTESPHEGHWARLFGGGGSGPGGAGPTIVWNASPSQSWILAGITLKPLLLPGADAGDPDGGVADAAAPDASPDPDAVDSAEEHPGDPPDSANPGDSVLDAPGFDSPEDVAASFDGTPDEVSDGAVVIRDIDLRIGCACRAGASAPAGPGVSLGLWTLFLSAAWRRHRRLRKLQAPPKLARSGAPVSHPKTSMLLMGGDRATPAG